ncbi:hypothetical protein QJS04_geneDACA024429 [Acorus gramineus]|uniref:Aminotransferase-like plant mobile domain-containing protein n=1 Tax=Acorus gramineus TaxID=55184 RepID=A0AAV9A355_ACOGR|nr:hypothetical protein QJS04_geneDACA024429 [Acorus gramineus]
MDPRIEPYVRASGLYCLTWMGYTRSDHRLLQALIERWRSETNTFHLRYGEMTITLHDVVVLAGLPIDGKPVTGITDYNDWGNICVELLCVGPLQIRSRVIEFFSPSLKKLSTSYQILN